MTANVSSKSYTCDVCGKVNNNAGNHGRHVASHAWKPPADIEVVEEVDLTPEEEAEFERQIFGSGNDLADPLQKLANAINGDPDNNGITFHNNGVGGYRPGSGRKPLAEGKTVTVAYVLTEPLVARVNEWMEANGIPNKSTAARRLLERGLECTGHEQKKRKASKL